MHNDCVDTLIKYCESVAEMIEHVALSTNTPSVNYVSDGEFDIRSKVTSISKVTNDDFSFESKMVIIKPLIKTNDSSSIYG